MTKMAKQWTFGGDGSRHKGVSVSGDKLTVEEAIQQGGLDWVVEARDAQTADSDKIPADDYQQIVRPIIRQIKEKDADGKEITRDELGWKTIGMVKSRYRIVQNRAAFTFFDNATIEGSAIIRAVGHMDFGRVVWALAERSEYECEIYPGDTIREHLMLYTSHDGKSSVTVRFMPHRVRNGTVLAIGFDRKRRNEVRVRHTRSAEDRLATVHNLLIEDEGYWKRWRAALLGDDEKPGFRQRLVTPDEIERVAATLFPAKRKKDDDGNIYEEVSTRAANARAAICARIKEQADYAKECYETAGQSAPNGTTALDVFLGVSEWATKDLRPRKGGNTFVSTVDGNGAKMRQKAFDVLCGL